MCVGGCMWKREIMHVNAHMNLCCVCLSVRPETSPTRWPAPSVRGSLHPLITRHHPRSPKTCLAGDPCSVWWPVWTSFFFCSHSSDCDFVEFDIFFFFVCFFSSLMVHSFASSDGSQIHICMEYVRKLIQDQRFSEKGERVYRNIVFLEPKQPL